MAALTINTANGPVAVDALGRMLMHEHLVIALPGWDSDHRGQPANFAEMTAVCVDKVEELKAAGFSSLLDPCPNDLGRNVPLMAEVAVATGFNIVFATGLYHSHVGGRPYWNLKFRFEADAARDLADMFVQELTEGVGDTGVKAGVIKVSTAGDFGDYEKIIFRAAALASLDTGAPITTHTDAVLGDAQLAFLTDLGVPAHRIVIGHSCGSDDRAYHDRIVEGGAYIGFDRFGLNMFMSDEARVANLAALVTKGRRGQVVISHDCPMCLPGNWPQAMLDALSLKDGPLHFSRNITPMLREAGVSDADIDVMLTDNPRRYFACEPIPPPGR